MRKGFTFLEMIFVIVIVGILAKFGTNLLFTAYEASISSKITNDLQSDSSMALKQISNRLQYRLKDSVVARVPGGGPVALTSAAGNAFAVLEWVGYDIDGLLGTSRAGVLGEPVFNRPTWSGFIDVDDAGAFGSAALTGAPFAYLSSPGTNTGLANNVIAALSVNGSSFGTSAIFFTGANSDALTDYGWNGVAQTQQSITAAHRVQTYVGSASRLADAAFIVAGLTSSFTGTDIYENYKLAWTAYALELRDIDFDGDDDLVLYYDYQPWLGENYLANGRRVLLMENVDTFKFTAVGDTIKLQICMDQENFLAEGYSICKETAVF